MGLHAPLVEMLIAEHVERPIRGDVLFLGRQTVYMNDASFRFACQKYGVTLAPDFKFEFDRDTLAAKTIPFPLISDRCVMRALGVERVQFLDVSAYEGADVVWDLTKPVPGHLKNRFDFIFDGSCLDNIFNPAAALVNMGAMLKPGGRVLLFEHGSYVNNPYTMLTAGWFQDYFSANAFADFRVYVAGYTDMKSHRFGPWELFGISRSTESRSITIKPHRELMIVALAEKGTKSTYDRLPIQSQYRDPNDEVSQVMERTIRTLDRSRPFFGGVSDASCREPQALRIGIVGADILAAHEASIGATINFLSQTISSATTAGRR